MKEQVVTFKVSKDLMEALNKIPNKSEFIRHSLLEALGSTCPLCCGSGKLSRSQKKHWDLFMEHHRLERCEECEELHIKCEYE